MANTNQFCRALLLQMADPNFPLNFSQKVTETGFLNMLLNQTVKPRVQDAYDQGTGHNKGSVIITYQPRSVVEQIGSAIDCDLDIVQAARTTTFTPSLVSQLSLYISQDDMARYCEDASRTVMLPGAQRQPATPFMNEFMQMIYSQLNGFYQHMDKQLATAMASKFGANVRNSPISNSAPTINLAQANTSQILNAGLAQILGDLQDNEFSGAKPMIVGGSNLFRNFTALRAAGMVPNQAGVADYATLDYDFYYSKKLRTLWGTEYIGVFDPGAVALVEKNVNVGSFAGQHGTSFFGQMFDPRVQSRTGVANYRDLALDIQIKAIDCPTSLTNGYTSQSATYNRGWAFIISKQYDLWVPPTDMFDGGDVARGTNGTLQYIISNS